MFYQFTQKNSYGKWDELLGNYVIIEASNPKEANSIALSKGLYFGGVHGGYDCPCCGDRWRIVREEDGDEVPSIHGSPIENLVPLEEIKKIYPDQRSYIQVFYKDGTIKYKAVMDL